MAQIPPTFIPLPQRPSLTDDEILAHARTFYAQADARRTVRHYSNRPVPRDVIETCLRAAGTAPSGANLQPWHFVAISDPELKRRIRVAAEEEERDFYTRLAPPEWLEALAPLGTDSNKPFLETAPWLIACFVQPYSLRPDGRILKHYYAVESVGIAVGMLVTALCHCGLVSLTHTPSPMKFLNEILGRPGHERPFVLLVVGHPADDAQVPDIHRKALSDVTTFL
jgi:iodotyrosine deiodinase